MTKENWSIPVEQLREWKYYLTSENDSQTVVQQIDDILEYFADSESRTCPECGENYEKQSDGHSYDAIEEFGKCVDCLGDCPYCS